MVGLQDDGLVAIVVHQEESGEQGGYRALGGQAWCVTRIDWNRHRCYVEPADLLARSLWRGVLPPESSELSQAQRPVLLDATREVELC